jgi:serine O-acetyltransferase
MRKLVRDRLDGKGKIALWGLGGLGRAAIKYWLPRERIELGIDSKITEASNFRGINCFPPSAEILVDIDVVIIASTAYSKIKEILDSFGFSGEVIYIYELLSQEYTSDVGELDALWIDLIATKNAGVIRLILDKPQVLVNITYRLARWTRSWRALLPLYYLLYVFHSLVCVAFSIQLPLSTKIGPGLIFAHYGTIVFTSRARIGSFFTIYQGCTVGTNDTGEGPVIGNFVSQFAGSMVLGGSIIGDYSRIGANSVVLDLTCKAYSTLVGCPARVVTKG